MLKTSPLSLMNALKMLPKSEEIAASKLNNRPHSAMPDPHNMAREFGMAAERTKSQETAQAHQRQQMLGRMRNRERAGKVELHQMLNQLTENNPGKREAQTKQLRDAMNRKPSPATDELLSMANNDPAVLDLLLQLMERDARDQQNNDDDDDGESLHREITRHLQTLKTDYANELNAASNTIAAFSEHSSVASVKQALRNLYYDSIVHMQSEVAVFDLVLDYVQSTNPGSHREAMKRVLECFKTLNSALSDDVAALAPSISPAALHRIMKGMKESVRVASVLNESDDMLMRMANKMPLNGISGLDLTHSLLRICQNGAYKEDLDALGEQCLQKPTALNMSKFFTNISMLLHGLPRQVWKTDDGYTTTTRLLAKYNGQLHKLEQQQALRS